MNIPLLLTTRDQLIRRLYMLPSRDTQFGVLASSQETLDLVTITLAARGWRKVQPALVDCEELWEYAESESLIDNSESPRTMLFEPSPFLVKQCLDIEQELLSVELKSDVRVLRCCDLGCGSGRNAVFLGSRGSKMNAVFPVAELVQDMPQSSSAWMWKVAGVDCFPVMLDNMIELSKVAGCENNVEGWSVKITGEGKLKEVQYKGQHGDRVRQGVDFSERQYDLLVCIRFLERSFFQKMADMVAPGGFLLISTFVESEVAGGPKNANRVLREGELCKFFGEDCGMRVLVDKVDSTEDGRTLNSFLARRI